MTFDAEQLKTQIPFYVTVEPNQKEFLRNLESLNQGSKKGYYISTARDVSPDEVLQGDGWRGFKLYSFETDE